MILLKSVDLFHIPEGESVSKRNLFDLIQYSKVENSPYWSGHEFRIGNTPQQGINWLGAAPRLQAVIIKTRPGSYEQDGWNDDRTAYRYSFKARNGVVSYNETANSILIAQPQHGYPILLFIDKGSNWTCEGQFAVSEIEERYVVLTRYAVSAQLAGTTQEEAAFPEGGRRYVTHLMVERSRNIIAYLKSSASFVCDVCEVDFEQRYGVRYIEAHHKIPVSSFTAKQLVRPSDFALLCPNCHRSVHVYMKRSDNTYKQIKSAIREKLGLPL
jgi:putative restriction endonuclease